MIIVGSTAAITGRRIERIWGKSHQERGNAKAKSHLAIRLLGKQILKVTAEVTVASQKQRLRSQNAVAWADCVVKGSYNCSLIFFFLLTAGYSISCQQWYLRCLTTSCSVAPPDWQLWSAHWQTTRLKGMKEAGTSLSINCQRSPSSPGSVLRLEVNCQEK